MADFDQQTNEGINNTKNIADGVKDAAKAAKNAGKAIAKSVADKGAKETAIQLLFGGLNPTTLAIVGGVLLGLLLISVIVGTTNTPTYYSQGATQVERITSALQEGYDKRKKGELGHIISYVNTNYGCQASLSDASFNDGKFNIETETCDVEVTFTPELVEFSKQIDAYANAVNSTIQFFEADEESTEITETNKEDIPEEQLTRINENGEMEITDYGQDTIDSYDSEYVSNQSPKYFKVLHHHAYSMFSMEKDTSEYITSSWKEQKTIKKNKCYLYEEGYVALYGATSTKQKRYVSCNVYHDGMEIVEKKITVTHATVEIPMYCDPTTYKSDMVENVKQNVVGLEFMFPVEQGSNEYEKVTIESYEKADEIVETMIREYEVSYLGANPIFAMIGEQGWDGDAPPSNYNYQKYLSSGQYESVWQHVEKITGFKGSRAKGSYRQCTQFVLAYLIDTYGITSLDGNGCDYVASLVNDYGWTLLDTPAPGCVFSSNATSKFIYGHTGIVLSVHDGNMVVAEGNFDGKATLRIYETTVDQFLNERYANRFVKFAAPKQ